MQEKNIGKIKQIIEDIDGNGEYIQLTPEEMIKADLKTGDWIKWTCNNDGEIFFEKATNDEVVNLLD